jgi:hypothetical protein
MSEMIQEVANSFLRKAIAEMIQYSRTQVGLRAEINEWAVETTGEFSRSAVESDFSAADRIEANHVLVSCKVAEDLLGLTPEDLALDGSDESNLPVDLYGEYPETVKKLEALFGTSHRN